MTFSVYQAKPTLCKECVIRNADCKAMYHFRVNSYHTSAGIKSIPYQRGYKIKRSSCLQMREEYKHIFRVFSSKQEFQVTYLSEKNKSSKLQTFARRGKLSSSLLKCII